MWAQLSVSQKVRKIDDFTKKDFLKITPFCRESKNDLLR